VATVKTVIIFGKAFYSPWDVARGTIKL